MQLTFLGTSYTAAIAGCPSQETGETGTFLGKRYAMKQAQVTHRQPVTELTYRGVRYSR